MMHDADQTVPQDWRLRLDALVHSRMAAPFVWGTNDCCMFAADAALAISGQDFAAGFRGSYSTEAQAQQVLQTVGGVEGAAALGGQPIAPAFATVGDVGLIAGGLAVCVGQHWVAPARKGLAVLQFDVAEKAWRVPRA